MEAVHADQFLKWAAGSGIEFDERYPESRSLCFVPHADHARFWVLPGDPAVWPHFTETILECLDPWDWGYLWPRAKCWPSASDSSHGVDRVRSVMLRGAGVPDSWPGALRFEQGEAYKIHAILFVYLAFGWCVDDDLFFFPDHGRQIVLTDHHDVIHVSCKDEDRVRKFVADMRAEGYELPTELPDETFWRPDWMGKAAD
jgi:hypothetical protein